MSKYRLASWRMLKPGTPPFTCSGPKSDPAYSAGSPAVTTFSGARVWASAASCGAPTPPLGSCTLQA